MKTAEFITSRLACAAALCRVKVTGGPICRGAVTLTRVRDTSRSAVCAKLTVMVNVADLAPAVIVLAEESSVVYCGADKTTFTGKAWATDRSAVME